jgi:hypothetical protein
MSLTDWIAIQVRLHYGNGSKWLLVANSNAVEVRSLWVVCQFKLFCKLRGLPLLLRPKSKDFDREVREGKAAKYAKKFKLEAVPRSFLLRSYWLSLMASWRSGWVISLHSFCKSVCTD